MRSAAAIRAEQKEARKQDLTKTFKDIEAQVDSAIARRPRCTDAVVYIKDVWTDDVVEMLGELGYVVTLIFDQREDRDGKRAMRISWAATEEAT